MAQMQLRQLGRLGYWQGQELRSRDLRDQVGSLQQLRWWHNRAAHGLFGVSQRLAVTVDSAAPSVVNVDCGLAYDCFGRELLLPAPSTIPLPAVTGAQYLVLAYSQASAALVWIAQNDFRASLGVPLALFQAVQGAYLKDAVFRAPLARALSRPRLAAGSTVPGNTPWEKLPNDAGLKVLVDTSSAGFTVTPFYLTSLNWQQENTEFSTPIVSVTNTSEVSFTLQLLLKDIGRELLAVVSGAGLVDTLDPPNNTIHFRTEIGFGASQDFQNNDVLARLLPQADLALPIVGVQNAALTLGLTSLDWHPQKDDAIVLGSLPGVAKVQAALQAISVGNPAVFPQNFLITRMAGTGAGSAAVVADRTSNGTLILKTPLTGLTAGDQVGTVSEAGTVTLKDTTGKLVVLTPATDLTGKVVLRKSSQMETAVPTTVISFQAADGTLKLKGNIGLADGDTLYVESAAGTVTSVGTALTLDNAASFQPGDLVGIGNSPLTNHAIVASIDGEQLIFTAPVQAAVQDLVVNADFPLRSTVLWAASPFLQVRNPSLFQPNHVVVRLKGTQALDSAVLVNGPFTGILQTSSPMTSLVAEDVLGLARFARTGVVKSVGTGSVPVAVQLQSATEAGFFQPGDTVANLNSAQALTLAVVDHITADTVFLRTAIADLVPGNTLGIVALNAVAIVTDPIPDATHFSVDDATAARAGGVAARFTAWIDASAPVSIQTAGASLVLNSMPDGLMAGDAAGFAALSIAQPKIRFDASAKVQIQAVQVQGVDQNSGNSLQANAIVIALNNQLATLQFEGTSSFSLRPENVQITESSHIEDFLAYAQRNNLYVCWLGCQMPLTEAPSCPGPSPAPCGCT
jgi:hypothetical protein